MAVGLPLSNTLMSIAIVVMVVGWVVKGGYRESLLKFFNNKLALGLSSVYIMHLIGLIYTSNFDYALKDLRIKLPILIFPFIYSAFIIDKNRIKNILYMLSMSVLIASILGFLAKFGWTWKEVKNARDLSLFVSHIRLSMMIVLCFGFLLYEVFHCQFQTKIKVLFGVILLWFIYFLSLLNSLSGFLFIGVLLIFFSVFYLQKKYRNWFVLMISIPMIALSLICYELYIYFNTSKICNNRITSSNYTHYEDKSTENGNYVWININENELRKEWEKRSLFPFDSLDLQGQSIKPTLIRYLASKGLTKDSLAFSKLNEVDIKAVEKGKTNYRFINGKYFSGRIYETIWEIDNYIRLNQVNNSSVVQRFEFWKTALLIIKENSIFGVGTGDVNDAFLKKYEQTASVLTPDNRLRSHNQFLTIFATFGIIGIAWFLFAFIQPLFKIELGYLQILFFTIALGSMLYEDTLETQAGVTFVMLFYSLFVGEIKSEY